MDSTGKTEPLLAQPGSYYTFRFSPDGTRLALTVDRGEQGREIEVYDWQHGTLLPLTATHQVNLFPIWTPDGKYIVFESSSPHGYGLGVVAADGSGTLQRIGENDALMIPYSFSPDGNLLYSDRGFFVARFDASDPQHLKLGSSERVDVGPSPAFSPDGHWIAYEAGDTGRNEVYVRPFHGSGAKWQVSTEGAGYSGIVWGPTDHRLYYVSLDNRIMAVDYSVQGNSFMAEKPRVWAEAPVGTTVFPRTFSVSADGKRFAVMPPRSAAGQESSVHVTFVMNLVDELRRRVTKSEK
jgi:Tol biopolymer transport system component